MSTKYLLLAFGIGASLGAGVALLFAPQSGEDTRKKLRQGAEDAGDYLEDTASYLKDQAERLSKEVQEFAEKTRSNVDGAVGKAGEVVSGALKTAQSLV